MKTQGDVINVHDVLFCYDPLTQAITNFVMMSFSGANSIANVNSDGVGSRYGWQQIATLNNVTGTEDEAALQASGHLG